MPIHPNSIRRPASPVAKAYTPANCHKYRVKTGDSWVSLAGLNGISPWGLIRLNYPGLPPDPQLAAAEVNWYLENYVGCTMLTADKRNYRFSTGDTPGEIWLPNAAAPATPLSPDDAARNRVLTLLRGPVVKRMNFGVGRIFIPSTNYEMLAKAIDGGYIKVKINASFNNRAEYDWGGNLIWVAPTVSDGLIIHECTHAVFDIRKITTVVEETEGLAYVAQALYGLLALGPGPRYIVSADYKDPVSWVSWQMIFDESTRLAGILTTKYRVSEDDARGLFTAIKGANFYRPKAGKPQVYDGLVDAFYNSL